MQPGDEWNTRPARDRAAWCAKLRSPHRRCSRHAPPTRAATRARGTPNVNSLIAMGALTSFAAGLAGPLVPGLALDGAALEEPVMLLAFVLLGRTLEARARLRASGAHHALTPTLRGVTQGVLRQGGLRWQREPVLLLAFVLLGRTLEARARLRVSGAVHALRGPLRRGSLRRQCELTELQLRV